MPWICTSTEAAVHFVLLCDISGFYNEIRTSAMEVEVFCVTIFDIIKFYVHTSEHRKVPNYPWYIYFLISFLFFGRRQSCQHPENTTKWDSAWVTHDGVIKWKYFETLSRPLWRQCNVRYQLISQSTSSDRVAFVFLMREMLCCMHLRIMFQGSTTRFTERSHDIYMQLFGHEVFSCFDKFNKHLVTLGRDTLSMSKRY